MRRRSNSHSPISLFTFLDTLVCTMGSLILMLLAMTPKIRERAEAREMARLAALAPPAVEAAPDPEPEPEEPLAAPPAPVAAAPLPDHDAEKRAAERQARRDAWGKELADAQAALKNKQAENQRLRLLLKEAQTEFKAIQAKLLKVRNKTKSLTDESQELTERETQLEQQEARIAQKIALTRRNLEMASRQQATTPNEFALVPYDGASGTTRRPIYIECSRRGFRFFPEDETLNPNDLEGFRDDYNPLLSGAQMLLRYWTLHRRESGGREPAPYVLLLVRPSGIENYLIARAYLSTLEANFGYELIEENWKLRVPDPDPEAKNILKQTLDMTVATRQKLRDAVSGLGGGSGPGGDRGGWYGGPPSESDPRSSDSSRGGRKPSVKFGPALRTPQDPAGLPQIGEDADGRNGRSGIGIGSGPSGTGGDLGSDGRPPGGSGRGSARGSGTGGAALTSRPAPISGGDRLGAAGGSGTSDAAGDGSGGGSAIGDVGTGIGTGSGRAAGGSRRGSGNPGPLAALNGKGPTGGTGSSRTGDISGGSGGAADSGESEGPMLDAKGNGQRGGLGGRTGGTGARPATLGGSGSSPGEGDGSGADNGEGGDSLELPPEYTPGRFPDAGSRAGNGEFPMRSIPPDGSAAPGGSSYGNYAGSSRSAGARNAKAGSSSAGATGSAATDADAGNATDAGALDATSSVSQGGGSPPSGAPMGGPGMNFRLGGAKNQSSSEKDDDPNAGPRVPDDDTKGGGKRGRSNRPRLWGTARAKASIGAVRKLQIRVLDDRLLIGSKDNVVLVGNGETVEEMIHQTVAGVERAAERWGDPPSGYFWMPTLRFVIYPGGDRYYERLHTALEKDWGLPSTMEYAPPPPKKAAGGSP